MAFTELAAVRAAYDYLSGNLGMTLFLCLGLGYLVGKLRFGSFTVGATLGTLLAGLIISQLGTFTFPSLVQDIFFVLFSFSLGYEAGPAFFASLKSSGVKLIVLSAFFSAASLGVAFTVCKALGFDLGTSLGLLAGSQTQSAILGVAQLDAAGNANMTMAYAITYIFGVLGTILFLKNVAPVLLRVRLRDAVKRRTEAAGLHAPVTHAAPVQMRAYRVEGHSGYVGKTIDELERHYAGKLQIIRVARGGEPIDMDQQTVLDARDEIVVIGAVDLINHFDDDGLTEINQQEHLALELMSVQLVLTEDDPAVIAEHLQGGSLLVEGLTRKGKKLPLGRLSDLRDGDILAVTGPSESVRRAAHALGYLKDESDASDIPFVALAIALGLFIGTLTLPGSAFPLLGASGGALIVGMVGGWFYQRNPRYGRMPDSTRWFLKSVGLNLFIAVKGLGAGESFLNVFSAQGAIIFAAGVAVTLLPHVLALFFGRRVLRMDPVDLLGGLSGSCTCTPALNTLAEETGSSIFAVGYAPAYAVGNVLLTFMGILLAMIL